MENSPSEKLQSQIADRKKKYLHLVEMSSSHNKDDHNAAFDSSKAPIPTQSTDMEYDKLNSKTSAQLSSHPISIENINMVNESSQDFKIIKERRNTKKFGETNSAEISVPSNRSGARLKTKMTSLADRYNNFSNEIKPASGFDKLPPGRINVEKHTAAKDRLNNPLVNITNSPQLQKNYTTNNSPLKSFLDILIEENRERKRQEGFDRSPFFIEMEKQRKAEAEIKARAAEMNNLVNRLKNSKLINLQARGFPKKDNDDEVILEYKKPVDSKNAESKLPLKPVTDENNPALLLANQRQMIFEQNFNMIQNAPLTPVENRFNLPEKLFAKLERSLTRNERMVTGKMEHKNLVTEAMNERRTSENESERNRKSESHEEERETLGRKARLMGVSCKDPALHSVGTSNLGSDKDIKMGQLCARNYCVEENRKGCDNELDNNREWIDSDNDSESSDVIILYEELKAKKTDRRSFGDLLSIYHQGRVEDLPTIIQNGEEIFHKLVEEYDRMNSNCENGCNTSSSALDVYRDMVEKVLSLQAEVITSRLYQASSSSSTISSGESDESEN